MKHKKGLTLIELLAVIAILGVLVVFAVPNVLESYRKSKKHNFVNEAKTVYSESVNKFAEQRTQGKKINLVSNDEEKGFNLNLQNEKDLKYTVRMDNSGGVTSFKLSNSEFCIVGVGDFLDEYSIDEIIELKTDEDRARCNITTFKDGEKLTIDLLSNYKYYPIETEHNPKKIYLKFNDDWYDEYNRVINKIEIPKKVNYFFDNFHVGNTTVIDCGGNIVLDNAGTGLFDDGVKVAADAYSTFSKKCFTIKYNGGSGTSGSMENTLYCYGDKINLSENKFTKKGHIFKGWTGLGKTWNDKEELPLINDNNENDADLTNFKVTRSTCNQANAVKELTAVWKVNEFIVTLVSDHKGFNSDLTTNQITVTYDGTYSNLPTPSISGYTFLGWYTAETGGTIVNKTDKVNLTGDITLYAHYKPNEYGLDINPDFNDFGRNYNEGAHVKSFDLKIVDENGKTIYDTKNIQDYCATKTNTNCAYNVGEFNATYYITNIKYRDGYKYKDSSLRNDTVHTSSNLNVISSNATTITFKHLYAGELFFSINTYATEWVYDYTGSVQSFTAPIAGTYKLEVWGAEGGKDGTHGVGGKGGYSIGNVSLSANQTIYVAVGGQGESSKSAAKGGFNGGGNAGKHDSSGGGGGATHIGKSNAVLKDTPSSNVYIVAGGGGGGGYSCNMHGGAGGGTTGGNGDAQGGSQTSGGSGSVAGSYGQGASRPYSDSCDGAGGGGGYYGGGASNCNANSYKDGGGGGGSGYIGGVSNGSMQSGVRSGNGYARITLVE